MAETVQKKLASEIEKFNGFQKDFQKYVSSRQQLEAQLTENNMVLDELKLLGEDSSVYKLIGSALIKQDLVEAKQNVEKRIAYINNEIKRYEGHLKEIEGKQEAHREIITKLQSQLNSKA